MSGHGRRICASPSKGSPSHMSADTDTSDTLVRMPAVLLVVLRLPLDPSSFGSVFVSVTSSRSSSVSNGTRGMNLAC